MRWIPLSPCLGGRLLLGQSQFTCTSVRHASLNSAIGRGIRRSQNSKTSSPGRLDARDTRRSSRRDEFQAPSRRFQERERTPRFQARERTPTRFQEREPTPRFQARERTPRSQERERAPRFQARERIPRSQERERAPRFQARERTPTRFQERERTPRSQERERAPRFQERERTPRFQARERTPTRFQEREPTPRSQERERAPRFQERERTPEHKQTTFEFDGDEFIRTGKFQTSSHAQTYDQTKPRSEARAIRPSSNEEAKGRPTKSRVHRITESMPERVKEHVKPPDSIPYTSPASEFIYGTGAVEAALRCSRRQLYKLYLYQGAGEELSPVKVTLRKLALAKNIGIKLAFAEWDRLLDKMSAGRPHNGCVLEASPLPKLPVRGFHPVPAVSESHFRVELAPQSREEAAVNGTDDRIPILGQHDSIQKQKDHRFPVVLLLDGVVDPGNLGAIIRSAYFLGIDAVVFAGRNSAPLSPVTIKASAGAAENMTLLHVRNEVDFIQRSQSNGWRFYAADAPGPGVTYIDRLSNENSDGHAITQSPSVLMMGSEGSGLSSHIKSHADGIVSVPGARHSAEIGVESDPARIDSLNVSVAAALLMEMFLRTPLGISQPVKKSKDRMW